MYAMRLRNTSAVRKRVADVGFRLDTQGAAPLGDVAVVAATAVGGAAPVQ